MSHLEKEASSKVAMWVDGSGSINLSAHLGTSPFLLCKRLRFKTLNIICRANFLYSSVQCYNYILFEINLLVFFQVCITVWMCPASSSPVRIIFLKIIFAFISYYI